MPLRDSTHDRRVFFPCSLSKERRVATCPYMTQPPRVFPRAYGRMRQMRSYANKVFEKGRPAVGDDRGAARPYPSSVGVAVDSAVGIEAPNALGGTDRRSAVRAALAGAAGPEAGTGRQSGSSGPDSRWLADGGMEGEDEGMTFSSPAERGSLKSELSFWRRTSCSFPEQPTSRPAAKDALEWRLPKSAGTSSQPRS